MNQRLRASHVTPKDHDEVIKNEEDDTVGSLRFDRDRQQLAALLILTGLPEVIQPLAGIADLVNGGEIVDEQDGTSAFVTVTSGLPFSTLFGALCCVLTGVLAMSVGIGELFLDRRNPSFTLGTSIFMQTAYILTVSSTMNVARVANDGTGAKTFFVGPPDALGDAGLNEPFVAAMGVLAILAYWFGMLGSISFLLISLHKFQTGVPHERDGRYYKGRLLFYSVILGTAGFTQFAIGCYLQSNFGNVMPGGGFVKVAMYLIKYPSMAIVVGLVQIMNAIWGGLRQFNVVNANDKGAFQTSIWFGWFLQLVLQIMVQPGILPKDAANAFPPSVAAFSFGLNFMPSYLDAKAQSTPFAIAPEYYGLKPAASPGDPAPESALPRRQRYDFDEEFGDEESSHHTLHSM